MKTKPNKNLTIRERVLKQGPYIQEGDRWEAVEQLLMLEHERLECGFPLIDDVQLYDHMGMNRNEIMIEAAKPRFVEFYLARSKKIVGSELARLGPTVVTVLKAMASNIEVSDNPRDKKEFLQLYLQIMEKFGISDMPLSKGEIEEEFDTDEALSEALGLVLWMKERKVCSQTFVKGLIRGIKRERTDESGGAKKVDAVIATDEAPKKHKQNRPNKIVETIRLQLPTSKKQEKISGNDNEQSVVENNVDGWGFLPVRNGEASNVENAQERSSLDNGANQ